MSTTTFRCALAASYFEWPRSEVLVKSFVKLSVVTTRESNTKVNVDRCNAPR